MKLHRPVRVPRIRRFVVCRLFASLGALAVTYPPTKAFAEDVPIPLSGELQQWHKLTFNFVGPATGETATPNPFTDYRLNVTFTHTASGKSYRVPGYYAADGDAANTSASTGNLWRAHFAPGESGAWTYSVSFRSGTNVAMDDSPTAGSSAGFFDGQTGGFNIDPSEKTGRDFRGKGRLEYVGKHHLRFAGTGKYFMKVGVDSPENLLSYQDFDGDFKTDGENDQRVKTWSPHIADWQPGDPVWQGNKGKGLIGAINYLASEGLNAFSFLTMNINGDDKNVFPYLDYGERLRMDVSRLDQWEIIFEHGTRQGMHLHFKTQETENELLLDGGNTGNQRKLYYRELIARFSHNLALNWNLGEEINNASLSQKQAWAQYFYDNDPYRHPIVIHNGASHFEMMGEASKLTGFSLQMNEPDFSDTFYQTRRYVNRSFDYGKPWVVACDEPGNSSTSLQPDYEPANSHIDARKNALWGNILAGGAGCEFYFGYNFPNSDLTCEDFRSRDAFFDYCRYAIQFFDDNDVSFERMTNLNDLVSGYGDNANRCLARIGEAYLVQLHGGGTHTLNLTAASGTYSVKWFNPRTGGAVIDGGTLQGGGIRSLGSPPNSTTQDWIVLVKSLEGASGTNTAPVVSAGPDKSVILVNASVHVTLNGTVTDDGLPDIFSLTRTWSQVSGPAPVSFSNPATVATTVTFTMAGTYTLRLAASDSDLDTSDTVTVFIKLPDVGGELVVPPIQDAFTDAGNNDNGTTLRVANGTRITYLQFDLTVLVSAPQGATLRLTEATGVSPGPVTLRLYAANSNDWTESGINGTNAPTKGSQLASFTGSVAAGQVVEFDIGTHLTGTGIYSLILEADAGQNEVTFASEESTVNLARPLLVIDTAENTPPAFTGFTAATLVNRPLLLAYAEILAQASDSDNDPVTVSQVDGSTAEGGEVAMGESGLTYTPAIDYEGADSFQLTVQDGRGGFATATLSLPVVASDGIAGRSPVIGMQPGQAATVRFTGVPALSYGIQRSGTLQDWRTIRTLRANPAGLIEFTDPDPPAGKMFYRVEFR